MINKEVFSSRIPSLSVMLLLAISFAPPMHAQTDDNATRMSTETNSVIQSEISNLDGVDIRFIENAALGNMAEIEMARLALRKSASDAIKQFAQQMVDDHTKMHNELMRVATSRGVTLPALASVESQELIDKMQELDGAAFDNMYIQQAGIEAHVQMEKLFSLEATEGEDFAVRDFAAMTLPMIQRHLQMAHLISSNARTDVP